MSQTKSATAAEQLVGESDHVQLSRLVTEHAWRADNGRADTPTDTEDTLRFAEMTGVRPRIEKYPLARAAEAYARMLSGKAEFRAVLTM